MEEKKTILSWELKINMILGNKKCCFFLLSILNKMIKSSHRKKSRKICKERGKKAPALFRLQWKGEPVGMVNLHDYFFWGRLSALRAEGPADINEALRSRCGFADRWWQTLNFIVTRTVFCSPLRAISS